MKASGERAWSQISSAWIVKVIDIGGYAVADRGPEAQAPVSFRDSRQKPCARYRIPSPRERQALQHSYHHQQTQQRVWKQLSPPHFHLSCGDITISEIPSVCRDNVNSIDTSYRD
jgi:hypothetical protein